MTQDHATSEHTSGQAEAPRDPSSAYHTYPVTTTHGPHDKSSYHGKPEDWARSRPKRSFGAPGGTNG